MWVYQVVFSLSFPYNDSIRIFVEYIRIITANYTSGTCIIIIKVCFYEICTTVRYSFNI